MVRQMINRPFAWQVIARQICSSIEIMLSLVNKSCFYFLKKNAAAFLLFLWLKPSALNKLNTAQNKPRECNSPCQIPMSLIEQNQQPWWLGTNIFAKKVILSSPNIWCWISTATTPMLMTRVHILDITVMEATSKSSFQHRMIEIFRYKNYWRNFNTA